MRHKLVSICWLPQSAFGSNQWWKKGRLLTVNQSGRRRPLTMLQPLYLLLLKTEPLVLSILVKYVVQACAGLVGNQLARITTAVSSAENTDDPAKGSLSSGVRPYRVLTEGSRSIYWAETLCFQSLKLLLHNVKTTSAQPRC